MFRKANTEKPKDEQPGKLEAPKKEVSEDAKVKPAKTVTTFKTKVPLEFLGIDDEQDPMNDSSLPSPR